jgi:lipoprotein-anchoring transpeptidase ErfK/SrfK
MRGSITTMAKWCDRRSFRPTVLLAVVSILAAACQAGRAGAGPARLTPLQLAISPAQGAIDNRPDLGIVVNASGGRLTSVTVRDKRGTDVAGYLNPSATTWHTTWALAPSQTYAVSATAVGARGRTSNRTATFETSAPAGTFSAALGETPGETVGVGMPVMVTFSRAIRDKAQVERSLELRTSKPVVGAWYWMDDQTVWFRPKRFWPAYTKVHLIAHLAGVRGGPGLYGAADLSQAFTVGESLVTVASTSTHRMKVWVNGKLSHDWPISTGQPGDDTPNGAYLTIEKGNPVDMDSCSYGVCAGDPGYYNVLVYDSVRFTWSGDYIHSAPWSVGEQGFTNVSHGCVNLAPGYAVWYYDRAVRGDPVTVVGSPVGGTWNDGWTIWFLSWQKLVAGSALKQAVVTGADGSYFADPAAVAPPVTAPPVTAPHRITAPAVS